MKKRLYAACVLVLVAGFGCAGWIYSRAGDGPDISGAYQIIVVNGVPTPIAPNESKAYMRDVQRYGGKLGVILDDIVEKQVMHLRSFNVETKVHDKSTSPQSNPDYGSVRRTVPREMEAANS